MKNKNFCIVIYDGNNRFAGYLLGMTYDKKQKVYYPAYTSQLSKLVKKYKSYNNATKEAEKYNYLDKERNYTIMNMCEVFIC